MTRGARFRGQPLLVLSVLLLGWAMLRVSFWESPFPTGQAAERLAAKLRAPLRSVARQQRTLVSRSRRTEPSILPVRARPLLYTTFPVIPKTEPRLEQSGPAPAEMTETRVTARLPQLSSEQFADTMLFRSDRVDVAPTNPVQPFPVTPTSAHAASRWSADVWLLARRDRANSVLVDRPSYGRSQAGGVLRYRLSAVSPLRPQAYVRASAALAGAREREIAAGVSARLLPQVPLRVFAETRVGETTRSTRVRPAAFVVTELAPVELPLGARAELYAQGGYVGGDYATAFVDGQARVERPLAMGAKTELSAGGGVWGGAQEGASRVDVGPTAAFTFPLGRVRGRVSADYRFRVSGDAAPASGPALTLSAGF